MLFFRVEYKVFRVENIPVGHSPYLCPANQAQNYMDATTIIAVALAAVVLLIIIGLVAGLVYYRWRTTELMSGLGEFIRQNRKQQKEIDELEREIDNLKTQNTNH